MREFAVDEIEDIHNRILEGASCEELAVEYRCRQADMRTLAKVMRVEFCAVSREWCDRCCKPVSELDDHTGWCTACTIKARIEAQRIKDGEEEARLKAEAEREADRIKQQRCRMRKPYQANPRKYRNEEVEAQAAARADFEADYEEDML